METIDIGLTIQEKDDDKDTTLEVGVEAWEVRRTLRRKALHAREALSPQERRRGSLLMTERILGHQWFYRSDIILCFVSYGSEIDTHELIGEALRLGKRVYVPKVTNMSEKTEMCFYRMTTMSELSEGYKGIPEPTRLSEKYIYREAEAGQTLMLMPGAAFDGYRNRLGYGKGFYDNFLADKPALQFRTIAVGFQCQMVEKIPEREGDIKPYQIFCL